MPRPLPTELIRHIIRLALPIVSYKTYRERYDLLLAFVLVNSTWKALAQEELYKEVFVKRGEELAAVLEGKGGEPGRRVHLGRGLPVTEDLISLYKFPATKAVRSLSMSHIRIKGDAWPSFEGLETLHLHYVAFGAFYSGDESVDLPLELPNGCLFRSLTTLSLVNVYLYDTFPTWTIWLTAPNLPALRRLAIGLVIATAPIGKDDDFVRALQDLAPQIQDLTIAEGHFIALFTFNFPWSAFTAIRRLALYSQARDQVNLIASALAEVPAASLSHLLVGYGHDVPDQQPQPLHIWETKLLPTLLRALGARPEADCLRALEVLVLHYGNEAVERGTLETSSQLEAVMKARGGVLERRAGWGEREGLLDWEHYLDVW